MRCDCGKFMRRVDFVIEEHRSTVEWRCACGILKYYVTATDVVFHRDALSLVEVKIPTPISAVTLVE